MTKIKTITLFILILLLYFTLTYASKLQIKYNTLHKKDTNGFIYEYVKNDPFKVRIYTLDNGLKVYLAIRSYNKQC